MLPPHTCTPELESLIIQCRPFYLPRELSSLIVTVAYIPPEVSAKSAINQLSTLVSNHENANQVPLLLLRRLQPYQITQGPPKILPTWHGLQGRRSWTTAIRQSRTLIVRYVVDHLASRTITWYTWSQPTELSSNVRNLSVLWFVSSQRNLLYGSKLVLRPRIGTYSRPRPQLMSALTWHLITSGSARNCEFQLKWLCDTPTRTVVRSLHPKEIVG